MQYQALYRRYRPQRFAEVVGQDHVTATLAREVVAGKIAHAYLFAGPRGTGKTTTARILAKALNCPDRGADGEPCDVCPSCRAVAEGTSLDVIELDAASHNKVEDVREIRVNASTVTATAGARRVYILDEAHMLSRAAGNALLKTLEEPPEQVVFVLATTEPYKLLDTIRSRSQRFDFHPVASETLVAHLARIADAEGLSAEHGALVAIAGHARGSVRDAMSLLEQVAALGQGSVTAGGVAQALGLAQREAFTRLVDAVADEDPAGGLRLVAELASSGVDLRRFVADAVGFLRGLFLAQYAPNLEEIVDEPTEVLDLWRTHAERVSSATVLRAIDLLSDALAQLRQGREERLVVELTLLRLTRPEASADHGAVAARLERLEDRLRVLERSAQVAPPAGSGPRGAPTAHAAEPASSPAADEPVAAPPAVSAPPEPVEAAAAVPAEPPADLTVGAVAAVWPAIVARIRAEVGPRRHAFVKVASPVTVDGGTVVLGVPEHLHFHLEQLRADQDLRQALVAVAGELLGGAVAVEFLPVAEASASVDDTEAPDKDRLRPADDGGDDPETLLRDVLGGEVVSE